ncbi:hypothetical protein MJO28_011779 [Puccinia striiformis f. sp. tritici]|uniref:DNA-directed RNA polymerase III subunit RPC4 n=3 Tax=Puccinia striiformis TaxID=27350 RepID=A0A0L0W075_9BASI|nr:hypothetical protein Pst134EA_021354 [Puccinia striiformis f. sp. tritici]KAI9617643.1 hypothetical protein H4Q26_012946 [Puccinia striiformis f. sp. tritici PST-130]KNF04908.1 hypothetical protein PSTG_01965 [Puccinia striiformis f. sp. tritici PST-78]POV97855.1 hypothetical protein PSHT_14344 [Puccinia striiformis]KAH9448240.1 hypothetical protein Pst134EB_022227 [Puccinia striiformis f. sp. tritici]KAH9457480.1 hypothetical protein Pst134EA_021354 [Puccinia striiformis f. sp. tritici]
MPPRGSRGRGRGKARETIEEPQNEPVLDPVLSRLTVEDHGGTSTSRTTGGSGDSKPAAVPSKFKPRMVKRVVKVEPDIEVEDSSKVGGPAGRGGRGRGRGADRGGRGRPDMVMTASGAFGMGPAEASTRRTIQGPNRSGMRRIDNSIVPTDNNNNKSDRSANKPWDGGPSEMLELYSDIDDEEGSDDNGGDQDEDGRSKVADLNDITLEHSMAPLSLPWDPKRIAERERLIHARNQKLIKLTNQKIKREQAEDTKPLPSTSPENSRQSSSTAPLNGRENTSNSNESVPLMKLDPVEHLDDNDENHKRDVKLKKDQLEELSNVGKQFTQKKPTHSDRSTTNPIQSTDAHSSPTQETYYVFQFPRNFPQFRDPSNIIEEEVNVEGVPGKPVPRKITKKKKPGLDDWLGWGKGGKRVECMGVPPGDNLNSDGSTSSVQGQIGELVIRRSGRVQMIIANVAYDVLPGAQPTFHQEISVIDPKPDSNLRAMFILGSTNHKFIVVPDVSTLLKREQSLLSSSSTSIPSNPTLNHPSK